MKAYGIELPNESDDDEEDESSKGAAKDILGAIAAKDASALDLALKRHYELCESSKSADEEEDAPDSEG